MIQYDRNMTSDDLVSYWHHGHVIVWKSETKRYVLASVVNATQDTVTLKADGQKMIMTRDQFFSDVILHRPPVNLVEKDGVVYRLTWAPPERDMVRTISEGILKVHRLNPALHFPAQATKSLIKWQAQYMSTELRTRVDPPLSPPFGKGNNGQPKSGLDLLIKSMNTPLDVGNIMAPVLKAMTAKNACAYLLSQDEYIYRPSGDVPVGIIYVGRTPLCEVRAQGGIISCDPHRTITPRSCWWRRCQDLIDAITGESYEKG